MWAKIELCIPVLDVSKQLAKIEPVRPNPVHKGSAACIVAASTLLNRNSTAILKICASKPYSSMWMA